PSPRTPHPCSHLCLSNAPSPPDVYTLSLHDALPISRRLPGPPRTSMTPPMRLQAKLCDRSSSPSSHQACSACSSMAIAIWSIARSEEHTSELQSRRDLVCRLLLEKKKQDLWCQLETA